jgi:hypothetical protein
LDGGSLVQQRVIFKSFSGFDGCHKETTIDAHLGVDIDLAA